MTRQGIKPRDIVTPTSLKDALTVTLAMGGSTNVALHAVEIARAAGIDLWTEVLSQQAGDGILILDAAGRHLDANTRCCSMLGRAREEILVDLSGGRVAVQSEPGRGNRFTVTLPVAPAPAV